MRIENIGEKMSVMPGADWRSESAYREVIRQADTADIAWEWLRRGGEYQKAFWALGGSELSSAASDDFRRKWGLTFCSRSEKGVRQTSRFLGA
ncbi:transcriptional regulator domain-containing protein [Bradyrhizobium zhanjiangense]|uniref:transcriptional regulator domain-containing protein n=1 Tax=Bradyrhizobium zhanjiangense TaxID=1325107 RepID=UPI001008881C|nr:DUF6499 domain-containing protein [Bradyrhizobium zhanjiangense]